MQNKFANHNKSKNASLTIITKGGFNMLQKLRGNQKGFTLIELMIVIAIIGILAAIAIPNFIAYRDKAFCGQAEHDAQNTLASLSSYYADADHTSVPDTADLIATEQLSLNNASTSVVVSGTVTSIMEVIVTDDSNRCPRDDVFRASMGGAAGNWSTN